MKKLFFALALLLLPALTYYVEAQAPAAAAVSPSAPNVPDVVTEGFRAFLSGGYASATFTWTKNSAMSLDAVAIQAVNSVFLQQVNLAGNFTGAEVIRVVNLSMSVEQVYCTVKYQRGALFMGFTCYKSGGVWSVTVITVDKDPSKVLPTNIMGGL
jgi:hypothetical protein